MTSKKLSTLFLSLLLVFTLFIAVGCGSNSEQDDSQQGPTPAKQNDEKETDTKKPVDNNSSNNGKSGNTSTVKLLKRNGVEWKENTKINSKRGAKSYKVVWGDTLSLIARTWHVNCYKLARYNKIKNIDLIEVDQIIYNYAAKS